MVKAKASFTSPILVFGALVLVRDGEYMPN